jgi:hypothetical protein
MAIGPPDRCGTVDPAEETLTMPKSRAKRRVGRGTALLVCCLFLIVSLGSGIIPGSAAALADDGDGGDGGGGGGPGGGGGGDGGPNDQRWPWSEKRSSRQQVCSCKFLVFDCKCRTVGARPPKTAPSQARTREVIVSGLTASQVSALEAQGYVFLGQHRSALLNANVSRIRLPAGIPESRAIAGLQAIAPTATVARNDLYSRTLVSVYRPRGASCGTRCEHFATTAWTEAVGRCSTSTIVGVIDTGVDLTHASLRHAKIEVRATRSPDRQPSEVDHGTGVVSLLAGDDTGSVIGLVRGARILAADAFHRTASGSSADAFDLMVSLDWLILEGAQVVNLSLSGPDNPLLKAAVAQAISNGVTLVAAAGLPDAGKTQGYPARYDGVIAVSAVDPRLRPSRLSARGAHITFAAPGVGLVVASSARTLQRVDGTSFATPFVTAAYALARADGRDTGKATEFLAGTAKDLGAPGRDPVYGFGIVQFTDLPQCR